MFLGFDIAAYPGDSIMAWLWGHNFRITGFYLNHARGGCDPTWLTRRAALVSAGWGLAPIYLGWQTVSPEGQPRPAPTNPIATAGLDAAEAAGLMRQAGFPPGSTLYCDVEDGTPPSGTYDTYLQTLLTRIASLGYKPGLYCSHLCAPWANTKNVDCWFFHLLPPLTDPIDPRALPMPTIAPNSIGRQYHQRVHLAGLLRPIDLDCFTIPDPSGQR